MKIKPEYKTKKTGSEYLIEVKLKIDIMNKRIIVMVIELFFKLFLVFNIIRPNTIIQMRKKYGAVRKNPVCPKVVGKTRT